jgi:hypothetical protein
VCKSQLLTAVDLAEIDAKKHMRKLKRKAAQATAATDSVPSSSGPAVLASGNARGQPFLRKKRSKHAAAPVPVRAPEWMGDSETQDMDELELRRNWDLSTQLLRRVLIGCHSWQGIFSVTHSTLQKINGQDPCSGSFLVNVPGQSEAPAQPPTAW